MTGKITSLIGSIGENPSFVAFNAHCWFAYATIVTWHISFTNRCILAAIIACLAAIKEFWFDLRYETMPPQTLLDSLRDFSGYLTGIILGVFCGF